MSRGETQTPSHSLAARVFRGRRKTQRPGGNMGTGWPRRDLRAWQRDGWVGGCQWVGGSVGCLDEAVQRSSARASDVDRSPRRPCLPTLNPPLRLFPQWRCGRTAMQPAHPPAPLPARCSGPHPCQPTGRACSRSSGAASPGARPGSRRSCGGARASEEAWVRRGLGSAWAGARPGPRRSVGRGRVWGDAQSTAGGETAGLGGLARLRAAPLSCWSPPTHTLPTANHCTASPLHQPTPSPPAEQHRRALPPPPASLQPGSKAAEQLPTCRTARQSAPCCASTRA